LEGKCNGERKFEELSRHTLLQAIDFFDYIKNNHTIKLHNIAKYGDTNSKAKRVLNAVRRLSQKDGAVGMREITISSKVAKKDGLKEILEKLVEAGEIRKFSNGYTI